MFLYQAKHKARGRYGVIDLKGQWLANFLGTKEQALARADELNQQTAKTTTEVTKTISSTRTHLQHFILTQNGWLRKGE